MWDRSRSGPLVADLSACACATRWANLRTSTSPNRTKLTWKNCEAWSDHERLKCLGVAAGGCRDPLLNLMPWWSQQQERRWVMQETETSAATDSLPPGAFQKERQYSSPSCECCNLKFLGTANTECFKLMHWGYKQVQSCLGSGVIRMEGTSSGKQCPSLANGQTLTLRCVRLTCQPTSQQYCYLILNQHQSPATSQSAVLFSYNK